MPAEGYSELSCKLQSTRTYCGKEKPCKEKCSNTVEIATLKSGAIKITFDSAQEMKLVKNKYRSFIKMTLFKGKLRREG